VRPGDLVTVRVTGAAPHHLVADAAPLGHRRTRAGDAGELGATPTTGGVGLGIPGIGAPAAPPSVVGCQA
jgi:tRNA-2-methylthio-N6-dimethylallyladenosine synthase